MPEGGVPGDEAGVGRAHAPHLQTAALHQKHDYDGKVQRQEYQAGELVLIQDIPWNEAAVPVVRSGTHHQSIGQRTGRRVPETRQAAHSGACGSPGGI